MLFLINLDEAHARRAAMHAQLDDIGLSYERIGIDFRHVPRAVIDAWFAQRFPGITFARRSVSGAEIGCWASHLCAWQALASRADASACTVLEDDVVLDPSFPEAIATLMREPVLDLVILGTSSRNVSTRRHARVGPLRVHRPLGTIYNTWGYVVSRTWVERFFASRWHIDRPIDHYTGGSRAGPARPRMAVLQPAVVRENPMLGARSQIAPTTFRIDRARIVELARRRIIASRASALYYKLYRFL